MYLCGPVYVSCVTDVCSYHVYLCAPYAQHVAARKGEQDSLLLHLHHHIV